MDLFKTIKELVEERKRIDLLIARLEEQQRIAHSSPNGGIRRRGRKGMNAAERREVSERMQRYWAQRRSADSIAAGRTATSSE